MAGFIGSPKMNFLPATVHHTGDPGTTLAIAPSVLVHLPGFMIPGESAGTLTLGVRPEHIRLSGTAGLPAQVQTVERLGSESYLHVLTPAGQNLTIRVSGETDCSPDQQIYLDLNPDLLHVFNADGDALRSAPASLPQPLRS